MFEISWSEILVVGVVALLVVGPKELPTLLRTVGRYVGMVKRQAAEFRAQFDEAIRETELEQLKRDVQNIKAEAESTLRNVERAVEREAHDARRELDDIAHGAGPGERVAEARHADALPIPGEDGGLPDAGRPSPGAEAGAAAIAAAAAAAPPDVAATATSEPVPGSSSQVAPSAPAVAGRSDGEPPATPPGRQANLGA